MLEFAAGELSKTNAIPIVDDTQTEGAEAYSLQLYSPLNDATIGAQNKTVVTIEDNESTISFSSPDGSFTANEGDGVVKVKLVRQGATFTPASARVKTSDWALPRQAPTMSRRHGGELRARRNNQDARYSAHQ